MTTSDGILVGAGIIGVGGLSLLLWNAWKKKNSPEGNKDPPNYITAPEPLDTATIDNIVREAGPQAETIIDMAKNESASNDALKEKLELELASEIIRFNKTDEELNAARKAVSDLQSAIAEKQKVVPGYKSGIATALTVANTYKTNVLLVAQNAIPPLKENRDNAQTQLAKYNYILDNLTYGTGKIVFNGVDTGWTKTLDPIALTARIVRCKDSIRAWTGDYLESERLYQNAETAYTNAELEFNRLDNEYKGLIAEYESYVAINITPLNTQLAGALNLVTIIVVSWNIFNDNIAKYRVTLGGL